MSDPQCEEYRELASGYADEQLEAGELLRLERHFGVCPACRAFGEEVRRLRGLLQAGEAFHPWRRPSPGFAAVVTARLSAETSGRAVPFVARRPVQAWAAMALAAAAAAVFFLWSWQRLLPTEPAGQVAGRTAAAVEEGSMENYLREHTLIARGSTLLGRAEEVDVASYRVVVAPGRQGQE